MKEKAFSYIIIFICIIAITGCYKKQLETASLSTDSITDEPLADEPLNPNEPSFTPQSKEEEEDPVLVNVNGIVIRKSEIDSQLKDFIQQIKEEVSPEKLDELLVNMRKHTLDYTIAQTLLTQKANEEGIIPDKNAINEKIAQIASQFPTEEEFQKKLSDEGTSEEELWEKIEKNLQIETLLKKPLASIEEVSDEDIEIFYQDNLKNFQVPVQLRASHILIAIKPEDTEETKAQKRQKLEQLKKEIINGADFAEVAREHSACPTKQRGGDLDFFAKGGLNPDFEEAAFKLKIGELSDIVETKYGYHLIKVTDHKEARTSTLEESKDKIKEYLNEMRRQKAIEEYIKNLRNSAKIDYSEDFKDLAP